MLSLYLSSLFQKLNDRIPYVVLRGYASDDEIEEGKDIDIFLPLNSKNSFHQLMMEEGWHTPKINTNLYPHEQFYRLTKKKIYKIDAVYGIYYGPNMLHYKAENTLLSSRVLCGHVYAPDTLDALEILMMHIIYDKNKFDYHNIIRFQKLLTACRESHDFTNWQGKECSLHIADKINSGEKIDFEFLRNKYFTYFQSKLEKISFAKTESYIIRREWNKHLRALLYKAKKCTIAIIGVDGAGKSTTIDRMLSALGIRGFSSYLGYRDFQIQQQNETPSTIFSIFNIYFILWRRYLEKRFQYGGIIIFDRYPYEIFINAKGFKSTFYKMLYKYLFPSPTEIIYIHCEADTSLKRKDDILNENAFRSKKKRFDDLYLNAEHCICFSSDDMCSEEIVSCVCELINEKYYEFLV